MDTLTIIKNSQVFKGLTDEEINVLIPYMSNLEFKNNSTIFKENDEGNALYIIVNGKIKITKKIDETHIKTLSQLKPGDCFGEMSLIEGNFRSADAVTLSDTSLLVLNKDVFDSFFKNCPVLAAKILMNLSVILSKRLREANEQILDILTFHFQK